MYFPLPVTVNHTAIPELSIPPYSEQPREGTNSLLAVLPYTTFENPSFTINDSACGQLKFVLTTNDLVSMTDKSICHVGESTMLATGLLVGFVVKFAMGEIDGSDAVILRVGDVVDSAVVGFKVDGESVWFRVGAEDSEPLGGKVSKKVGVPVVIFVVGAGEGGEVFEIVGAPVVMFVVGAVGKSVEVGAGTGIVTGAVTGAATGTSVGTGIGTGRGTELGAVGTSEEAGELIVGRGEIDGNVDGKSETEGSIVGSAGKLIDGSNVSVALNVGIKVADDSGVGKSVAKGCDVGWFRSIDGWMEGTSVGPATGTGTGAGIGAGTGAGVGARTGALTGAGVGAGEGETTASGGHGKILGVSFSS
jgi:hypothetical protein